MPIKAFAVGGPIDSHAKRQCEIAIDPYDRALNQVQYQNLAAVVAVPREARPLSQVTPAVLTAAVATAVYLPAALVKALRGAWAKVVVAGFYWANYWAQRFWPDQYWPTDD